MKVIDWMSFKGHVTIYKILPDKSREIVVDKDNLVVYTGREWVLSRIFNINNSNITPTKDYAINWISFGSGGAPTSDPFNPTPPESTDTSITEITVDANDSNLYQGKKIPLQKTEYSTTLEFQKDSSMDNKYLMLVVSCLLNENQANDELINEAALWISNTNVATTANSFTMFSHVTFPTFKKTSNFKYLINWIIHS